MLEVFTKFRSNRVFKIIGAPATFHMLKSNSHKIVRYFASVVKGAFCNWNESDQLITRLLVVVEQSLNSGTISYRRMSRILRSINIRYALCDGISLSLGPCALGMVNAVPRHVDKSKL